MKEFTFETRDDDDDDDNNNNSHSNKITTCGHFHKGSEEWSTSWPGWLRRHSDSLQTGRSGDRIPVGARFSVPVQTNGYRVFPGGKAAGAWR